MGSQALAPPQVMDVTLSLFGGNKTDIAPSDCPEGVSPDNQDGIFLPGDWQSRPCLARLFAAGELNADTTVLYEKTYIQPNNDPLTLLLTSDGALWVEDVNHTPLNATSIATLTPGLYGQSVTAFGREYIAFSDLLHGQGVPLQYDGTNLDRVTQDGPGVGPTVANFSPAPATIQNLASPVTVNIAASAAGIVFGGVVQQPTGFNRPPYFVSYYTYVTITTTTNHGLSVNQQVTIAGATSTPALNGTWYVSAVPSVTTFQIAISVQVGTTANGGGGTVTVTASQTSLARQNNLVTAVTSAAHNFLIGWQVQISGVANKSLGGGIASISRDGNGVVTVTTASAHGIPQGATIAIVGVTNPDTSFNGTFPVASVPSPTTLTYQQGGPAESSGAGSGNVQDIWNVTAFIQSTPSPTTFTYQQIGANDTTTASGTATIIGQVSPGAHGFVVMFLTRQGALTRPSPPVFFTANGGGQAALSGIPLGPPNVVARLIAATGAGGANYFTLDATPQVAGQITGTSLLIPDNLTTAAVLDFSDSTLFEGIAIDQVGNDLFSQRVLGPVLGFFSYASRLGTWGDYNKIENLLSMSFGGGTIGNNLLAPCGWSVGSPGGQLVNLPYGGGVGWEVESTVPLNIPIVSVTIAGPALHTNGNATMTSVAGLSVGEFFTITGNALANGSWIISAIDPVGLVVSFGTGAHATGTVAGGVLNVGGTGGQAGMLIQPAYQDASGTPILLPSTKYKFRIWLQAFAPIASGFVVMDLYSLSLGAIATAAIPANQITTQGGFLTADFNAELGSIVPTDMVIRLYDASMPALTIVTRTDAEIIYAANPYNNDLVHFSYALNPEGFSATTGDMGAADDASAVQCLALLRQSGLLETLDGVHIFQDNGQEPDTWLVNQLTRAVGAVSLRSGDPGKFGTGDAAEDWALISSKNGIYLFAGAEFWKISQEISRGALPVAQDPRPCWDDITWSAQQTIVAKNDPAKRRAYFAVPLNGQITPTVIFVVDYREMDTATQIAGAPPVHITIQGKMKSSDLTRKWSTWNVSANDIEILIRPGNQREVFFAGGLRNGVVPANIYSLNPALLTDDDYGRITPYYTTYAFTDHDTEQALGLGSDMHLYKHIHAFVTGVGLVAITPIVNSLWNFQPSLSQRVLTKDTDVGTFLNSDLEWTTHIRGQRVFFRISVQPLPGATDVQIRLQKLIVGMMKDPVAQFRQSGI